MLPVNYCVLLDFLLQVISLITLHVYTVFLYFCNASLSVTCLSLFQIPWASFEDNSVEVGQRPRLSVWGTPTKSVRKFFMTLISCIIVFFYISRHAEEAMDLILNCSHVWLKSCNRSKFACAGIAIMQQCCVLHEDYTSRYSWIRSLHASFLWLRLYS